MGREGCADRLRGQSILSATERIAAHWESWSSSVSSTSLTTQSRTSAGFREASWHCPIPSDGRAVRSSLGASKNE
jgi:hypothetical protein